MKVDRGRLTLEIRRARGGFLAVLVLGALTIGAIAVIANGLRLNMPWTKTYTARVAVDDAKGVVPGKQQVRISGLPVGKVTKAQLVDGRPVLTIMIKGKYAPLYRDARLRLRPKTPLDDLYLNVESRGQKSAGEVTSGQVLTAERTIVPVDIGRVLDAFNAATRVRMEQAIDELGRALPDRGAQLRETIVRLAPFLEAAQRLSRATAERRGYTRRLVHNFRLTMEELGRRDRSLRMLVRGGAETFTQLAARERSLTGLLDELPPTLRQLQPAFAALRSFSSEATPALRALRRPLPALSRLVAAVSPTAQGLDRAFAGLAPTAPRLDRITKAIVPCELAIQKFFANTLSLMKFYDARGLVPRGQTVDGDSANQRAGKSCAPGGPRK